MANAPVMLKKDWEDSAKAFEAMTKTKKPVEEVKKCWLRSNKTLTTTLDEFDAAYKKCDLACDSAKADPKDLAELLSLVQRRFDSIKKMERNYIIDLEDSIYAADKEDQEIYKKGLKYLKSELLALVARAEQRCGTLENRINSKGKDQNVFLLALATFEKNINANVAKMKAVSAKMKTLVQVAVKGGGENAKERTEAIKLFNDQIIFDYCRSIRVWANNALEATKRYQANIDAGTLKRFLDVAAYWNNAARNLPDNASLKQILERLKELKEYAAYIDKTLPYIAHPIS